MYMNLKNGKFGGGGGSIGKSGKPVGKGTEFSSFS